MGGRGWFRLYAKTGRSGSILLTPENYGFKADGKSDVTDALQEAINQVKREKNFGILFLPEGNYRISKTIQIPSSIRLIGYGKKRPVIYLGADTPGFQTTQNYMIWFTGGLAQEAGSFGCRCRYFL